MEGEYRHIAIGDSEESSADIQEGWEDIYKGHRVYTNAYGFKYYFKHGFTFPVTNKINVYCDEDDTSEEISDDIKDDDLDTVDPCKQQSKFRLRTKQYLIILPGRSYDDEEYLKLLNDIEEVDVAYIVRSPSSKKYSRGRFYVIVRFKKNLNDQSVGACHRFCWENKTKSNRRVQCEEHHNMVRSIITAADWQKCCGHLCKLDGNIAKEIRANEPLDHSWTIADDLNNKNKRSKVEMMGRLTKYTDVVGFDKAWNHIKRTNNTRMKKIRLIKPWTEYFMEQLWMHPDIYNGRSVSYFYQRGSGAGKTLFCSWLVQEFGPHSKCVEMRDKLYDEDRRKYVKNTNYGRYHVFHYTFPARTSHDAVKQDSDFRNTVYKAYMGDKDNTGKLYSCDTLVIELTYSQKLGPELLATLEAFKGGKLTNEKYFTDTIEFDNMGKSRVIIFGNQKPNVGNWRWDDQERKYVFSESIASSRWTIFEICEGNKKDSNDEPIYVLKRRDWRDFKPYKPN